MPELPEVETIRRQLAPLLQGRAILWACSHPSNKFASATNAIGTTIQQINRKGKYLICVLNNHHELIIHLGMSGSVAITHSTAQLSNGTPTAGHNHPNNHTQNPLTKDPYTRACWQLGGNEWLIFRDIRRFGRIRYVPAGCYDTIPTLANAGPDALSKDFTPEALYQAMCKSSRRIPTQLLSQKPVAGIGNIYSTEALWMSGIHPAKRRISKLAATKLHGALLEVLHAALNNGGTTLRDYRNAEGTKGNHQNALACYGRSGQPCVKCTTTLQHRTYDGRTITFCPKCQLR